MSTPSVLTQPTSVPAREVGGLRWFLRGTAPQDWVVVTFLAVVTAVSASVPAGEAQRRSLLHFASLFGFVTATVVLVRGGLLRPGWWGALLYRLAIYGGVQLSYFFLGNLLPLVNQSTLDHELYHLDLTWFGLEPALVMDRWVSPVTTEWFAYFYFCYFFVLALHVIPILLLARHRRVLGEFALGLILVFCVGHTVYMLVPGFGPYHAFPEAFSRPLPRGAWFDVVMGAVQSSGAMMDIFPSLHTAAPTFIALFSFRHRDKVPFRFTWLPVGFTAVVIIGATMFLRWHYLVDVVAGLCLAVAALEVSVRLNAWESARRVAEGLPPSWPPWPTQDAPPLR